MGKKMMAILLGKMSRFPVFVWLFLWLSSCQYGTDSDFNFSSADGTGGSMARFAISGNHLFTVDQTSMKVFDLADPMNPEFMISRMVGFNIETIFPQNQNLFLGTSTGMYIFDVTAPGNPQKIAFYEHVFSCDPVVSDGKFAYVTLSSLNQQCWRSINELQIIDLQNLKSPTLVKQVPLSGPRGLAIRNDTLWVCDQGLKILDVRDKQNVVSLNHFSDISAYDIILNGNLALVTGETGFVQYRITGKSISKLSEIRVSR
jgi:hypothetical protein